MRKILILISLLFLVTASKCYGAMTYGANYYITAGAKLSGHRATDPLYLFMNEVEGIIEDANLDTGSTFRFDNGATFDNATNNTFEWNENDDEFIWTFGSNTIACSSGDVTLFDFGSINVGIGGYIDFDEISAPANPASDVGRLYVADATGTTTLYFKDSAGTNTNLLTATGVANLDEAYNGGSTMDVDGDAVTLTVSNTDNNRVLDLVQNDTTSNPMIAQLTNTGSGGGIQFACTSGNDLEGTSDSWTISYAGAIVAASADLTGATGLILSNDATITNATDTEIKFLENSEDFSIDFLSDQIVLKSSTGVDDIDFGELDDIRGLNRVYFDATSGGLTHTGSAGTAFAISELGSTTAQLNLVSTGTAAQAILIEASQGGIDILASGATTGEDIDIAATGSSVNISSSENVIDSIVIESTAGGIDILASGAAATEDIDIVATGSSVNIRANENNASAIVIDTAGGGGTSEAINILNDTGSADDSIDFDSTAGGMDIDLAKSFTLSSTENTIDSIDIVSTVGGIEISAAGGAATEDVNILATSSSVQLKGGEADAGAITLDAFNAAGGITVNYGTADMIITGTGVSADFALDCDLFSIDGTGASNVSVTGGAGEDFTISQAGAADNSLILSSTGTGDDALQVSTSAGGIDITNGGAAGGTEDLDISSTNASVYITGAEADAAAIKLNASNAAGGIDVDCGTGTFDLLVTGGAFSIDGQNAASNITLTADGAADDFTIQVDGDQDSSLILDSDGVGADALRLYASHKFGDIDIDAGDAITIDSNNVTITTTEILAGLTVNCNGAAATGYAIDINAANGGIHLDAEGAAFGDILISAGDILTLSQPDTTGIVIEGGNASLLFEGVTADACETTITVTDPTDDRTITLPDYTGAVPLVVDQSTTQSTIANGTVDVTGTDITLGNNWMDGGETIHYRLFGTKSAANNAMSVQLYLLDGNVLTLTSGDADAGDWTADIYCYSTAGATQDVFGTFSQTANGIIFDHATGAKDMSSGGTIKCTITSGNVADTVTVESVIVDMWVAD